MKRLSDSPFLAPALASIVSPLHLYISNSSQVSAVELFIALTLSLLLATATYQSFFYYFQEREKSALLSTAFLFCFYSFGHFTNSLVSLASANAHGTDAVHTLELAVLVTLSIAFLILLITTGFFIEKQNKSLTSFRIFLRNFLAILIAIITLTNVNALTPKRDTTRLPAPTLPHTLETPDIYFIVLDGYAPEKTLHTYYQFDNSLFTSFLKRKNFQLPSNSTSNYQWTFLSLASTLSMKYLDELGENPGKLSVDRSKAFTILRNNEVAKVLRSLGYSFIQLASTYTATAENPFADKLLSCRSSWFNKEFIRVLFETSALRLLTSEVSKNLAACHLKNFDNLKQIAKEKGPKFVFSHILPPHHPYLFDKKGNILESATVVNQFNFQEKLWEDKKRYLEQLQFVNVKIMEVVESILSNSTIPPVIIIASDHGPTLAATEASKEEITKVRFSNFLAVHTPGKTRVFNEDISLVNLFRALCQSYFGLDLPPLINRHIVSTYQTPYQFSDFQINH